MATAPRIPEKDPRYRPFIRYLVVGAMLAGFVVLLVHYFEDSPDVSVEQVQLLGHRGKYRDYPIRVLYDRPPPPRPANQTFNSSYFGRAGVGYSIPRLPLSCPCTTASIHWRKYVRFYALTKNTTEWNITWDTSFFADSLVYVPPRNNHYVNLLKNHIVKDPYPLDGNIGTTAVCDNSTMWNAGNNTFSNDSWVAESYVLCYWLATMVIDTNRSALSDTATPDTSSTDILETPMLLDRETFFMTVAENAREAIVKTRLRFQEFERDLEAQKYTEGLADYLTELLDKGELDEYWQSYYEGAYYLQLTTDENAFYNIDDASVFYVGTESDPLNPIFLHAEVNWTQYYETCAPVYCERTKKLTTYNRLIWAIATVGGLSTIVIAVLTMVIWPAVAYLVGWISNSAPISDNKSRGHPI